MSFSSEEVQSLIETIDKAKDDFVYSMNQIRAAIEHNHGLQEEEGCKRVVQLYSRVAASLVKSATQIELRLLEEETGL